MDVQVPGVAVQVWHPPVQLDEQQTFCTQKPLPHSPAPLHDCPALLRQLPLKQA
jgi:hypothetical protein